MNVSRVPAASVPWIDMVALPKILLKGPVSKLEEWALAVHVGALERLPACDEGLGGGVEVGAWRESLLSQQSRVLLYDRRLFRQHPLKRLYSLCQLEDFELCLRGLKFGFKKGLRATMLYHLGELVLTTGE